MLFRRLCLHLLLRHTNVFDMVPTADFGWKSHNLEVRVSWMSDKEYTFPGILDKTLSLVIQY